jgi:hypothetical protein
VDTVLADMGETTALPGPVRPKAASPRIIQAFGAVAAPPDSANLLNALRTPLVM